MPQLQLGSLHYTSSAVHAEAACNFIMCFADLVKIRAQALDPVTCKPYYHYRSTASAFMDIYQKEGGMAGLYRLVREGWHGKHGSCVVFSHTQRLLCMGQLPLSCACNVCPGSLRLCCPSCHVNVLTHAACMCCYDCFLLTNCLLINVFWLVVLSRGVVPTTKRAVILTATQFATYDEVKYLMLGSGYFQEGLATHFVASTLAGLAVATTTNPVDLVKSRYMNQPFDKVATMQLYHCDFNHADSRVGHVANCQHVEYSVLHMTDCCCLCR